MKVQVQRKRLKEKRDELKKILKKIKRPANKLFFEAHIEEVECLLNPKIGSSKPSGIAKKF